MDDSISVGQVGSVCHFGLSVLSNNLIYLCLDFLLDIRVFDEENQSPQQSGGGCLSSSQKQIQRAQSQIGLSEAQIRLFVLFRNAEKIQ